MASNYTGLGVQLMTTGEKAGTWGTLTNTNWNIMEQISGGYVEQSIASTPTTLSVNDGTAGATLAHRIIELTGAITGNRTVTIPLDVQTFYIVKNSSSGAFTVEFKYVTGSGSSVTWSATDKGTKIIYATANDGTNPDIVDTGFMANLVEDTTPQLGGNLDVNGNDIVHSVVWLSTVFLLTAGLFILAEAEFLAVIQVLVYVGAISVVIIFGIMLTKRTLKGGEDV